MSRSHLHTHRQLMWDCLSMKGTRDYPSLSAKQADELGSAHLLCLLSSRDRAASADVTGHFPDRESTWLSWPCLTQCCIHKEKPSGTAQKLKEYEREVTQWNFIGTLCKPLKKNLFWRKQAIQTPFAVLLNCTGGKLETLFFLTTLIISPR